MAQNISPSAGIVFTKGESSLLNKERTSMQQSFEVGLELNLNIWGFRGRDCMGAGDTSFSPVCTVTYQFQWMSLEDPSECNSLVESGEYSENGNRARLPPFPLASGSVFSPSTDSLGMKSSRSSSPSVQKKNNITPSSTLKSKSSTLGTPLFLI